MDVTTHTEEGANIVAIAGSLDAGTAAELEGQLAGLGRDGTAPMILDLAALDYVSSAGLRVLLSTAKQLKRADRPLALCSLTHAVAQIFEISGFSTILTIAPDRPTALQLV
jgi:stage II sporulation protein AA (anti-sigma F factor antagonist)